MLCQLSYTHRLKREYRAGVDYSSLTCELTEGKLLLSYQCDLA